MNADRDTLIVGADEVTEPAAWLDRREALRLAAGGFILAASRLLLPDWLEEEAEAREGAYGGRLGSRHGKNHRGRHRRRTHGNKKDKGKGKGNGAPKGGSFFRNSAITVRNNTTKTLTVHFYDYPVDLFGNEQSPELITCCHHVAPSTSLREFSGRVHMGAVAEDVDADIDVDANVQNFRSRFPRGRVFAGSHLGGFGGTDGTPLIADEGFFVNESHADRINGTGTNVGLKRLDDSDKYIEWELTIG